MRRAHSLEKKLMLEKIQGGRRRGRQRKRWLDGITQWTWVWVSFGSWWWTGSPGMLQSMGSQRIGLDWETELNWTDLLVDSMIIEFNCRTPSWYTRVPWHVNPQNPTHRHVRIGNQSAFLFNMVTRFIKTRKGETNSKMEVSIFIIYRKESVSYKLVLAKDICPLPLWWLNSVLLKLVPLTCPEGSSWWRGSHAVLQGNSRDKS